MATKQKQDRGPNEEERERAMRTTIINSPEFHKWYEVRKHTQPSPSDPYRAFMIDRSLYAKTVDEKDWGDYPNRTDNPPIDNRQGFPDDDTTRAPRRKHRRETFVPTAKVRPQHEGEALHTEMIAEKNKFMEMYHLPDLDVVVEKREGSSYSKPLFSGSRSTVYVPEHFYKAVSKESHKKNVIAQFKAINSHEYGHHAQLAYGGAGDNYSGTTVPHTNELQEIYKKTEGKYPTQTIRQERFASDVAFDFHKRKTGKPMKGAGKLSLDWAFGTYAHTAPKSMQGPEGKFVFDESKQLIVRRKDVTGELFGGSGDRAYKTYGRKDSSLSAGVSSGLGLSSAGEKINKMTDDRLKKRRSSPMSRKSDPMGVFLDGGLEPKRKK